MSINDSLQLNKKISRKDLDYNDFHILLFIFLHNHQVITSSLQAFLSSYPKRNIFLYITQREYYFISLCCII